jgi:hypothetical protein
MNPVEQLKAFLQVPELSTVGSAQERAAFIAIRMEGLTVREAGQAIGVSKSQIKNLADLFQAKLAARIMELRRKRVGGSPEYRCLYQGLYERLCEVREESGSDDYVYEHKVGNFDPQATSQEDWAEMRGTSLSDDPDE